MGIQDSDDEDEHAEEEREPSIFDYDIDSVEIRKQALLSKYPWAINQVEDALMNPERLPRIKKKRAEQLLQADRFLEAFSTRGSNMSFEEQK